jgi:hypothetical protein
MDRQTALSGKTKGWIKVKIDRGQHVRPQIVNARVVEHHGRSERCDRRPRGRGHTHVDPGPVEAGVIRAKAVKLPSRRAVGEALSP